ncbi:MAG: hypothetical protein CME32_01400 [Gimesia sp.]|nr:hypothetical protein [Gimesia sp.]
MDQKLLDYLQRILNAWVYDVAIESPLELASKLSARLENQVWLKREDTQPEEFDGFLDTLGDQHMDETSNPVYHMFLR